MSVFPSRSVSRKPLRSSFWAKRWPQLVIPVVGACIALNILFLANLAYIYGALFRSAYRVPALKLLAVDYDGAEAGASLSIASRALQGPKFPTIEYGSPVEYPTPESLEEAVCKGGYWGAIHVHRGASERLMAAIEGRNTTAYNQTDVMTHMYVGAYYPLVGASFLEPNFQALVSAASRIYYSVATEARTAVNLSDATSSSVYLDPFRASASVRVPTNQGGRVFLNTASMVMPSLMQFFFLMALNGVHNGSGVLANTSKRDVYMMQLGISLVYTLICGLGHAGYIWAFREDWGVDGGQFAETWMCLWLNMQIQYLVVDTTLDSIVPITFFSFFLLTWIFLNLGGTIFPLELLPGFYRLTHALPAHNIWILLMGIWSGGCKLENHISLPVLFSWWAVGHCTSAWSVRQRCLTAEKAQQEADADDFAEDLEMPERDGNKEPGLSKASSVSRRQAVALAESNRADGGLTDPSDSCTVLGGEGSRY